MKDKIEEKKIHLFIPLAYRETEIEDKDKAKWIEKKLATI